MVNIEINKISPVAKEGDVLDISNGVIEIDIEETQKRKHEINELTNNLWN